MKVISFVLIAALAGFMTSACVNSPNFEPIADGHHPEASPFDTNPTLVAQDAVDKVLESAALTGKHAMIVMGANWCHDSRALAGWFETPRFEALLKENYSVAYIDVGQKDRNIDVAQRFGLDKIVGTGGGDVHGALRTGGLGYAAREGRRPYSALGRIFSGAVYRYDLGYTDHFGSRGWNPNG